MPTPKQTIIRLVGSWLKKNFEGFITGYFAGALTIIGLIVWYALKTP